MRRALADRRRSRTVPCMPGTNPLQCRWLALVLAAALVLSWAVLPAHTAGIALYVGGMPIAFDVPPHIEGGRVLVPVHGVF